jgi:hypothetical protein
MHRWRLPQQRLPARGLAPKVIGHLKGVVILTVVTIAINSGRTIQHVGYHLIVNEVSGNRSEPKGTGRSLAGNDPGRARRGAGHGPAIREGASWRCRKS